MEENIELFKDLFPTKEHLNAARKIVEILGKDKNIETILLTCSCARGQADKTSCLDIAIIIKNIRNYNKIDKRIKNVLENEKELKDLRKVGQFTHVDYDIIDGIIKSTTRGWTSGPDCFELNIGNYFIYSKILFDRTGYFYRLKKKWLPYYNEKLREKRLEETIKYCINNLDHIPIYTKRKLFFQSFDRLYKATQEFMQALFIKKRKYPVAYDKWIKYQYYEILKMPEVYKKIVSILQIKKLESDELIKKERILRELVEDYLK